MKVLISLLVFALSEAAMLLQPLIEEKFKTNSTMKQNVDCLQVDLDPLQWAYAPDDDRSSPSGIQKRGKIFDDTFTGTATPVGTAKWETSSADTLKESSRNVAIDLGIEGSYLAFSGTANLGFTNKRSTNYQTMRKDKALRAIQCELHAIGDFRTFPQRYLSKHFVEAIRELSASNIIKLYGAFYAKEISVGGEFKYTYIMDKGEDDNTDTFDAEIKAAYGKGPLKIEAKSKTSLSQRTKNSNGKIERTVSWRGGNAIGQLALDTEDSIDNSDWANSFKPNNLYPFKYDLFPIWDLISSIDKAKGDAVEKAFENDWAIRFDRNKREGMPLLPGNSVTQHGNVNNAKGKAQNRIDQCVREKSRAQGWIDTWWASADRTRNKNWRGAANDCINEMRAIIKKLGTKTVTVKDFKDYMREVIRNRYSAGQKHWGWNGNDSKESNRVHRDTHKTDQAISNLF